VAREAKVLKECSPAMADFVAPVDAEVVAEPTPVLQLGCIFLQESSGFLRFPFLWHFFHRNHDSCSAVTFSERHQETCLYGDYVESYVGYQFVRQQHT
jgi:hypothetical protein